MKKRLGEEGTVRKGDLGNRGLGEKETWRKRDCEKGRLGE